MKLMLRFVKYFVIILVLLLLLIAAALGFVLKTASGTNYVLSMVPGLTVEGSQGSLSGGWSASKLTWQDETTKATVTNPSFVWSAKCLFKYNVCIDKLTAEQVNVELADNNEPPSEEPIILPSISLPVTININMVKVDKFILNGEELVNNIQLNNTYLENSTVTFEQLAANYQQQIDLKASGKITLDNSWPLEVQSNVQIDGMLSKPLSADIKVGGELQNQLLIDLQTKGYVKANATGKAQVLEKSIPAELTVNIQDFLPEDLDLPPSLKVNKLTLKVAGDLEKGFNLQTDALLAGTNKPINLSLKGKATDKNLTFSPLRLSADKEQFVSLDGKLDWSPDLLVTSNIDFQNFPWQELYPMEIPVELQTLKGKVSYGNDAYQADIAAKLTGPAGNFSVDTKAKGDMQQVALESLHIQTDDGGTVTGDATVGFDPNVTWQAKLKLQAINPNYWVAELPGSLNGTIDSEGSLQGEDINTETLVDIQGTLRQQPTLIKTKLIAKEQQWQVPELFFQLGNNRIKGHGQLDSKIQADLDINLPALQQLLPELKGMVKGQLQLAGSLEKPQGTLNLTGQKIDYAGQSIGQLFLTGSLDQNQQGNLQLKAQNLLSGETKLGNLTLNASGDTKSQEASIQLTGGIVDLASKLASQQDANQNWLVTLSQLNIKVEKQEWKLQAPALLTYTPEGKLTLDEHCLQNGKALFCGNNQQQLMPELNINYHLTHFPLETFRPWLPADFRWQGELSSDIVLSMPKQGPVGNISIHANGGTFRIRDYNTNKWKSIPYKTLQLDANLTPRKINGSLLFNGLSLGTMQANVELDPLATHKPINGDFSIKGFDIGLFQGFHPDIEELSGKVNGQGTIKGTLEKPYISGKIALTNANVIGDLPVSVEQMQLTANIEGERVDLNGRWRSGQNGGGVIKGHVDWRKTLDIDISAKGHQLPVTVVPYAKLEANTDIQLKMQGKKLIIQGEVNIPKGEIEVRDLPPSTVQLSSDAVIVTDQPPAQDALELDMDIKVKIGQDRLKFRGFGLTADVTGDLTIGKNLLTQGVVVLKNGKYRAYGQHLDMERANVFFTGSYSDPSLEIEAVRVVNDVTAGLRISGLVSEPKVTVFSRPGMSQEQALSYIIFGRPLSTEDDNMIAQAAVALGVAGGAPALGSMAEKIGIKDFQLDTAGAGDNTSVVASGKITEELSIHYGVGVFNAINTLALRYQLTKKTYVEAASGAANSVDFVYKYSF